MVVQHIPLRQPIIHIMVVQHIPLRQPIKHIMAQHIPSPFSHSRLYR